MLLERLYSVYPHPQCELNFASPLELLVATILSAQCTDVRVKIVTRTLFRKYRATEDYLAVPEEELQERHPHHRLFPVTRPRISAARAERILEEYGGRVPRTVENADPAGSSAEDGQRGAGERLRPERTGSLVDTHVTRLSGLLGLTEHTDPVKIERDLMAKFPRKHWTALSHLLILHGRRVCAARRPNCAAFVLNDLCPLAFAVRRSKSAG